MQCSTTLVYQQVLVLWPSWLNDYIHFWSPSPIQSSHDDLASNRLLDQWMRDFAKVWQPSTAPLLVTLAWGWAQVNKKAWSNNNAPTLIISCCHHSWPWLCIHRQCRGRGQARIFCRRGTFLGNCWVADVERPDFQLKCPPIPAADR